jgi:hypothetical protein
MNVYRKRKGQSQKNINDLYMVLSLNLPVGTERNHEKSVMTVDLWTEFKLRAS